MDESEMYQIAMSKLFLRSNTAVCSQILVVLHPEFKLDYFKNAKWKADWIKTAEQLLQAEYKRKYVQYDIAAAEKGDIEVV